MGKLKRLSVALVLFLGFLTLRSAEKPRDQRNFAVSVRGVMVALEKAVMFYWRDRYDLNLDAYFGLRIAQGSLHELTSKKRSVKALLKYGILKQTKRVSKVMSKIAATSTQVLMNSSPGYYNLVGLAVSQPWEAFNVHRRIDQSLIEPLYKTRLSDDILQLYEPCLARLLGSPRYGNKPCDISEQCWAVMVRPGEIGYVLTHQALYLMFGEQKGCLQTFLRNLRQENRSLESVYDKICSNIYAQLLLVERIKPKTRGNADLLMEQSVVCGLLGYYQFLTLQRLKNVLQWQRVSGCFGNIDEREADAAEEGGKQTMRRPLMAKELQDGCESHITGVGTALLSIYLRYLLNGTPVTDTDKQVTFTQPFLS